MNKFDKEMILNFALQGMKAYKEELKSEFKAKYDKEDTDYILDEINNINKLIKELDDSIKKEDTEIV